MIELKDISTEKLPAEQKNIIELIGLEAYIKLAEAYGGTLLYITKLDGIIRESRNREICGDFDGYNYRHLALKYNLSEQQVRLIVAVKDNEMRTCQVDGQLALE
jgi:Mor family transcriptional regulator